MELITKDAAAIINLIYKCEDNLKNNMQKCLDSINKANAVKSELIGTLERTNRGLVESINNKNSFLEENVDGKESYLESINNLISDFELTAKSASESLKKCNEVLKELNAIYISFKDLRQGKETFFEWKYIDALFVNKIKNEELKTWILINLKNAQKIIFCKFPKKILYRILKDDVRLQYFKDRIPDNTEIYLLLNKAYGIDGKEMAYIYIESEIKEVLLKCTNQDIIKRTLLSYSEDLDLTILNNISNNNDLTKLYEIANKEAKNNENVYVSKNRLDELNAELNKIIEMDCN